MTTVMKSLGWRWRRVGDSPVAHFVPASPGKGSRTACNLLPVPDESILGDPVGLWSGLPLCPRCARAER